MRIRSNATPACLRRARSRPTILRQEAQPSEVGGEQGKRADTEAPAGDRRGADDQDETEADIGRAVAEGEHALAEDAVANRCFTAPLDEPLEPGKEVLGGAVDLDGRGRRHHVADEPGDVTRRQYDPPRGRS